MYVETSQCTIKDLCDFNSFALNRKFHFPAILSSERFPLFRFPPVIIYSSNYINKCMVAVIASIFDENSPNVSFDVSNTFIHRSQISIEIEN